MVLALLVSDTCGRSGTHQGHFVDLEQRCAERMRSMRTPSGAGNPGGGTKVISDPISREGIYGNRNHPPEKQKPIRFWWLVFFCEF